MYYIRISETLADKGKLIPHTDDVYKYVNRNKDCYRSIYFYNEEQKKQFDITKSVAGITEVITSRLIFDFDSGSNLEQAKDDALELCQRLVSKGVNPEDVQVYFSGSKGFGIEINTTSMLTVQEFKNITFNLAADLSSFDKVINNASRIIRVPLTKHQTTGNFKIPLTIDELTDLSTEEIVKFSKDISSYDLDALKEAMGRVIELPQAISNLRVRGEPAKPQRVVKRPEDVELDLSNKPKFLTNCKYSLQEGHFGGGERNSALMTLAATYKNNGFSKAIVYRMLKGVAQTQSELSGQSRFSDKEIYKNIIEVVFSPTWKGGMYSCQQEGWLRDYCQALGDKCCENDPDHKHEVGPKLISSVKDKFKHYVKNIDKNTVKTGIGWMDQKLFISTGTNVGIIGAAGSGKTALALDILSNTSKAGVKTVFASLDMSSTRMYEKILYRVSGLSREEIYQMYQEDREAELEALMKKEFENVFFFDKSSASVEDIKNYVLACEKQLGEKIKLVCVDYFERVTSDFSDDTQASKRVAGELQDLVNELDVALITFVQPNKFSIAGGPDQPIRNYTAIKGSSFLYQSFRQILALWRPFYNPKDFKDDKYMTMAILKNDLGELDEHSFHWEGKRGMIREMDLAEKFTFEHLLHEKENAGKDDDGL